MGARARALLIGLGAALCAPAVPAQSIRMPDFRQPATVATVVPGEPCGACGRIAAIREVNVDRTANLPAGFRASSGGPADYNIVGAVVYLPLGEGSGGRPFVGGVGTSEMKERFGHTTYDITLQMDDGTIRSFQRSDGGRYRVGDRVRVAEGGQLDFVVR